MKRFRVTAALALLTPLFAAGLAFGLDAPPAPSGTSVLDQAEVLTPDQEQAIDAKILAAEKQTGNEVGVLTIRSLQGDALEDYSLKVARGWGIGQAERDSGVLLLVVVDDRRLRIEVGYGLEGALPDARAGRIIQDRITPAFKANDYYKGIDSGVDGILLAIKGETDPNLNSGAESVVKNLPWEVIFYAVLFVPLWLGSILARTKSWWLGGVLGLVVAVIITAIVGLALLTIIALIVMPLIGLLFDRVVSRNFHQRKADGLAPSWWAGGTHLGGGGGSGGFGGGSFGGGGASGSW